MASKWMVSGTYFEAGNCDVVCPCLFTSKPTNPDDCPACSTPGTSRRAGWGEPI